MMALWPWALMALLVPMFGGAMLDIGPVRPDIGLSFVSAAAQRRFGLAALLPACAALCAARFFLAPPDARAEALMFAATACTLIVVCRLAAFDAAAAPAAVAAAAFLALVTGTALLQRGTGDGITMPALPVLAGTLVYTVAWAAAFTAVLPERRRRP